MSKSPEAVICTLPSRIAVAESLAAKYKLPLLDDEQGQFFSGLAIHVAERIYLSNPDKGNPLTTEFDSPALISRLRAGSKQPLGRACGLHKRKGLKILDCTAGMGQDMITLAAMGAKITALERNPYIHLLLSDGMQAASLPVEAVMALKNCTPPLNTDAGAFLNTQRDKHWDVIYLDPMFSGYRRKALPKKSMQILAEICGEDSDAEELLKVARENALSRVVVKRGPQAPVLSDSAPDLQIKGNRMRFDIYLTANQS